MISSQTTKQCEHAKEGKLKRWFIFIHIFIHIYTHTYECIFIVFSNKIMKRYYYYYFFEKRIVFGHAIFFLILKNVKFLKWYLDIYKKIIWKLVFFNKFNKSYHILIGCG